MNRGEKRDQSTEDYVKLRRKRSWRQKKKSRYASNTD